MLLANTGLSFAGWISFFTIADLSLQTKEDDIPMYRCEGMSYLVVLAGIAFCLSRRVRTARSIGKHVRYRRVFMRWEEVLYIRR